jgi:trehalose synthase
MEQHVPSSPPVEVDLAASSRERAAVRKRFLLTRLIADELRLYEDLLGTRQLPTPVAKVGLAGEERDPVCGMLLDPEKVPETYEYGGDRYYFCSRSCQVQFEAAPEYFLGAIAGVLGGSS